LTLRRKLERAKVGVKETSDAYHQMSARESKETIEAWQKVAENASMERGDRLKIYEVNLGQGMKE
jgi:hypothetical protein